MYLTTEYFKAQSGTFILHIAYRGAALAVPDLVSGKVDVMFDSFVTGTPQDLTLKVNQAVNAALAGTDVKDRFARLGAEPAGRSSQSFEAMVKADSTKNPKWKKS